MGFDLAAAGIADLLGFGATDAAAGAGLAEAGSVLGADALGTAGLDAATGSLASGVGAGVAGELGAGATDAGLLGAEGEAAAAGAGAAGAGAGAADLSGAEALSDSTAFDATAGMSASQLASLDNLGLPVGGQTADLTGAGAADLTNASQAGSSLASGAPSTVGQGSTIAASEGATVQPSTIAAGQDPNITAALDQPPEYAGSPTPSTAATAAAQSAGPSGLSSLSSGAASLLNNPLTKLGELALPLGFLGYNLAKGPPPLPSMATNAVNNAQAAQTNLTPQATANVNLENQTAATDLALATNNQISPSQTAALETQRQNLYNQLYQQLANQGNTNPQQTSAWIQGKQQIDADIEAQKQQMITTLLQTAFSSQTAANQGVTTAGNLASQTDQTLLSAAGIQVQQDAEFNASINAALESFGMLAAFQQFGGSKPFATSP